ncbi:MAG TPA: TldD/PmbA family protein [Bryobacteraceae bacterium]|nr:TldD/PmbA family protein [Bryobacteraceae bacterium]
MPVEMEAIFGQVLAAARSRGVADIEAIVTTADHALTRFANNQIHQNVAERMTHLSVRPVIGGRTARASTNRLDRDGIEDVVEQAIAITKLTEPDPELLPLAEKAEYQFPNRFFAATSNVTPEERARAVAEAIRVVDEKRQTAAGIYSTGDGSFAIFNSRGVAASHTETHAQFSITAMAGDSSGWAKQSACYHGDMDPVLLAACAASKAQRSSNPRLLPPGRYTVVLEPAAVLDLVGQMFGDFSATAIRDGRSFLNDRLGKKVFGDNITIRDDCFHSMQAGAPFDGEGVPRRPLMLVENGVVREVAYSRQAAAQAGATPTGHGFPLPNEIGEAPANIVFTGGEASVDDMIRSTGRGILVTRLWYIREVDPYEKIFTGMTRDGTFLIEGGEIAGGVRNFRFNQSLLELLSNVETLGPALRAAGEESIDMVVPAMKVRDFNFTEVTRF